MTAREIFDISLVFRQKRLKEVKAYNMFNLCLQLNYEIEMINILYEKFKHEGLLDVFPHKGN